MSLAKKLIKKFNLAEGKEAAGKEDGTGPFKGKEDGKEKNKKDVCPKEDKKETNEEVNVKEVIKALIDFKPSNKNEDQGKFVQLIRGMAFSEDEVSDKFMMKLAEIVNDANFGDLIK